MSNRDEQWIYALVNKQSCKSKLSGDPEDPQINLIKDKRKHIRESITVNSLVDYSTLFVSSNQASSPTTSHKNQPNEQVSKNFLSQMVEQNEHKEKKKQKKQLRKRQEAVQLVLSENLMEVESKSSNIMAELLKASKHIILTKGELYIYENEYGYYKKTSRNDAAKNLRSLLSPEDQLKVTTRQYIESYEQLLISEELEMGGDGDTVFLENRPYVNCRNGVVDVMNGTLLKHSSDFHFKHFIDANYIPGEGKCTKFLEYVEYITGGDEELKRLLRAILGYLFSEFNNAKKAFLIYGIPNTGKSVLLSLIRQIIGKDDVSSADLASLYRQEYVASLKSVNICPDLKNEPLKDVGWFKSLVSHDDVISARALYSNPQEIKCETKMIFASNHLLSFDASLDIYDIEAVFNRLIYFEFQNPPISDRQDNKHLSEDLYKERDLIFTWAMKGLRDYVENNETFPKAKLSEEVKRRNMAQYCPEKTFFEECIKFEEGKFESSSAIRDAFAKYCKQNGITTSSNILNFLNVHQGLRKTKKRIDADGGSMATGNAIHVYEGIRVKDKYRA